MVLASAVPAAESRLNPAFEIENTRVVLNPLQIVSISAERLGERVASLNADGDRVIAAIDLRISRAWD